MTIVTLALASAMAAGADAPTPRLDTGEPLVVARTHTLDSRVLGQQRTITVGLPPGYDKTDSSYPVVYVLDGAANFSTVQGAAEFLSRYGKVPAMIVVASMRRSRKRGSAGPRVGSRSARR